MKAVSLSLIALCSLGQVARAEDKAQFGVFSPTPAEHCRALAAGDTAYTVDAGRLQLELNAIQVARDTHEGTVMSHFSLAPLTVKLGVTHYADVQVAINPYELEQMESEGGSESHAGFGDMELRLKLNLFGNDGGAVALALQPYAKLPTASGGMGNGRVEGGLLMPIALALPLGIAGSVVPQVHALNEEEGFALEAAALIGFTRHLVGPFGAVVELELSRALADGAHVEAAAAGGIELAIGDDYLLATGAAVGLTEGSEDLALKLGLTARL